MNREEAIKDWTDRFTLYWETINLKQPIYGYSPSTLNWGSWDIVRTAPFASELTQKSYEDIANDYLNGYFDHKEEVLFLPLLKLNRYVMIARR